MFHGRSVLAPSCRTGATREGSKGSNTTCPPSRRRWAAGDLVRAGKLAEAEQAARDLQARFPEVHDGYDRLGMVHEARGENRQAADCYRKVIALVRDHPDDYGPGFEDVFVKLVNRLDPPGAT